MKSIRLEDGDLAITLGRSTGFVYGKDKLLQDLELWLREPLGQGTTTPRFGSLLDTFLGNARRDSIETEISNEVQRVLGLYQANQMLRLKEAKDIGQLRFWSKDQIVQKIDNVKTTFVYDRAEVQVLLTTLARSSVELDIFVSSGGVQVG